MEKLRVDNGLKIMDLQSRINDDLIQKVCPDAMPQEQINSQFHEKLLCFPQYFLLEFKAAKFSKNEAGEVEGVEIS